MIKIFPNIADLNNFAAEKFVELADQAIKEHGQFTVALAGGSTPKALYALLASDKFKNKVDWTNVYFFFGDERNVLPDHPESNFRMANESLFQPLQIADSNIFRWKTELEGINKVVDDYERKVLEFFNLKTQKSVAADVSELPKFHLILLGMGNDGHTASLFPETSALVETEKLVVENYVEKLDSMRFTLTFSSINNARNIIFLVAGADKAATLDKVIEGEFEPEKLPSQNVKPNNGKLLWLVDDKAAALLQDK